MTYPTWVHKTTISRRELQLYWSWENARRRPRRLCGRYEQGQSYGHYLRSLSWHRFRAIVLIAAAHRCADCDATAEQVHHLNYARIGREKLEDVIPLCGPCHEMREGGLGWIGLKKAIGYKQGERLREAARHSEQRSSA